MKRHDLCVIGSEYTSIFAQIGVRVTLAERYKVAARDALERLRSS